MEAGSHTVFLSLGSNRGDRIGYLAQAASRIGHLVGPVTGMSGIYETDPWGFADPVPFLNQVLRVVTHLSPRTVLEQILGIEKALGRERRSGPKVAYDSRTMDIDILLYDDLVVRNGDLIIPHPGIPDRRFVLVPLADLAAGLVHPVSGLTVSELLERCPDPGGIREVYPARE